MRFKDIVKFSINQHSHRVNEICFINKKKILKYMEYNHEMRKFIDGKFDDSRAPDLPDLMEWNKDWMILLSNI